MKGTTCVFGLLLVMGAAAAGAACDGAAEVERHGSPQPSYVDVRGEDVESEANAGRAGCDTVGDCDDPSVGGSEPRLGGAPGMPADQWRLGTLTTDLAVASDGRVWVAGPLVAGATEGSAGEQSGGLMTPGGGGHGTFGVAAMGQGRMAVAGVGSAEHPRGWLATYALDGAELARWQDEPGDESSLFMGVAASDTEVVGAGYRAVFAGHGVWDAPRTGLLVRWRPDSFRGPIVAVVGASHASASLADVAVAGGHAVAVGDAWSNDEPWLQQGWIVVSDPEGNISQQVMGPGTLRAIAPMPEGGFVAVGSKAWAEVEDVWVVCLDTDGRALSESTFDMGGEDHAAALAFAGTGALLLAGRTSAFSGDQPTRAWVVELDLGQVAMPVVTGRRLTPWGSETSASLAVVALEGGQVMTGGAAVYDGQQVRGWLVRSSWP